MGPNQLHSINRSVQILSVDRSVRPKRTLAGEGVFQEEREILLAGELILLLGAFEAFLFGSKIQGLKVVILFSPFYSIILKLQKRTPLFRGLSKEQIWSRDFLAKTSFPVRFAKKTLSIRITAISGVPPKDSLYANLHWRSGGRGG